MYYWYWMNYDVEQQRYYILVSYLKGGGRAHSTKKYDKDTSIIQLHNGMFYEIQKSQQ